MANKIRMFVSQWPSWTGVDIDPNKKSTKHYKLTNGCEVKAVATSKDALRGFTPTVLVFDEAAFIEADSDFWAACMASLSTGGIYRATNWLYQGCGYSKLMPDYSIRINDNDLWTHSRTVGARWGNKSVENLAKSIGQTFYRKEETAKHRYIYFLVGKKEKKRMMKNLKIPVFSYNEIKPYTQLIQKVHVKDGVVERIEILQGVDNGWSNKQIVMTEDEDGEESI